MSAASRAQDLQDLCATVLDRFPDDVEGSVTAAHSQHDLTRFANSHIHQHVGDDAVSLDLRVLVDGRPATASTTRTDRASLELLVVDTIAVARVMPVDETHPGFSTHEDPMPAEPPAMAVPPTPADRADAVAAFIAAADDTDAAGYCESIAIEVAQASTTGRVVVGRHQRSTLDGIHRDGGASGAGHVTARTFDDIDAEAVGAGAADLCRRSRGAGELAPERLPVVLGPEAVASIAVFLGFYGFNARAVAEQRSFAQVGQAQFDASISIRDDVTDPRSCGLGFDLEGTGMARVDLVRDGTTVAVAHDRRTAMAAGTTSTGNHVTGSDVMGPIPTDLVVAPGRTSPDELVRSVGRGVLVTSFNYCRVLDPRTVVVTGLTRNGTFLIEDGQVSRPLQNLRFTQSFADALAPGAVLGVGDDDRYADSEFGAGIVIAPSIALANWTFTGGARG